MTLLSGKRSYVLSLREKVDKEQRVKELAKKKQREKVEEKRKRKGLRKIER